MKVVLLALVNSRKVWVGSATMLVIVALRLVLPKLGVSDEAAISKVADDLVYVALAIIGALTAQNVVTIATGNGDAK